MKSINSGNPNGFFCTLNSSEECEKTKGKTLTEHWNGKRWQVVASPNAGKEQNILNAVTAVSTNDIWAVGFESGGDTLIEHWNGKQWNIVPSPAPGKNMVNILNAIAAISANDIWAVGGYLNALTMHWDGKQWSTVPSPKLRTTINSLGGVAATSAEYVWAVGSNGGRGISSLIETLCGS